MDGSKLEKDATKKSENPKLGESPIGDNIKGIQQNISAITNTSVADSETFKLTPANIRAFQEYKKAPLPNNTPVEERWPHLDNITDISTTITDLKSGLLDYYGTLFIPSGHDIASKIESLRIQDNLSGGYRFNTNLKNSSDIQVSMNEHGLGVFNKKKSAPLLDDLPDPYSPVPNSIYSFRDHKGNPISGSKKVDDSELIDFHGLAELPGKGMLRAANHSKRKSKLTERNKSKGTKLSNDSTSIYVREPENLLGYDLKELSAKGNLNSKERIPYNEIGEMMESISRNCKDVQGRLSLFEDALASYQCNPNMAQFIPPVNEPKRFLKNYQSKDPISTYIYTLYRDLYNKSEINSRRIEVIKAKLKVLQSHSKPKMLRIATHSSLGL